MIRRVKPQKGGKREDPKGVAGVSVLKKGKTEPLVSGIKDQEPITIVRQEQKERGLKAWECCHTGDGIHFVSCLVEECVLSKTKCYES